MDPARGVWTLKKRVKTTYSGRIDEFLIFLTPSNVKIGRIAFNFDGEQVL
jgi:hypothetical protein